MTALREPIVEALRVVRIEGVLRRPGEQFLCDLEECKHLLQSHDIRVIDAPPIWNRHIGRDLNTITPAPGRWSRVVACLNIWNNLAALEQTMPTWFPHVDAVIAVDGAYRTTAAPQCASTDGTLDFLRAQTKVEVVEAPRNGFWPDQNAKRNAYLERLQPGDLAFVVDADEFVTGADRIRTLPAFDVGWVRIESPLYQRPYDQPRLFRAVTGLQYAGRHHWMYRDAQLLTTHQYGGALVEHAVVPLTLRNARNLGYDQARVRAKRVHAMAQHQRETEYSNGDASAQSDQTDAARESLRIATVAKYDAGLAVSRLHTAINTTTPHASSYFCGAQGRPFDVAGQFDLEDTEALAAVLPGADVVHCHVTLNSLSPAQLRDARWLVLHHHGSMYRANPGYHIALAEHYRALSIVATLELLQYGAAHWLPNPMPIARYRRLRAAAYRPDATFRVAHSPSKREIKGTDVFLGVCEQLRRRGFNIEPVLIEQRGHAEGLLMKAACDAAFDSFFIGLQCSGLEAAAMGMPVIAGDAYAADQYRAIVGHVPHTYANDAETLEAQLVRLMRDEAFRAEETARVVTYVETWHDEARVALRYLDLLDQAFDWRYQLQLDRPDPAKRIRPAPLHPTKPVPRHPERPPVTTPSGPSPKQPEREPVTTR